VSGFTSPPVRVDKRSGCSRTWNASRHSGPCSARFPARGKGALVQLRPLPRSASGACNPTNWRAGCPRRSSRYRHLQALYKGTWERFGMRAAGRRPGVAMALIRAGHIERAWGASPGHARGSSRPQRFRNTPGPVRSRSVRALGQLSLTSERFADGRAQFQRALALAEASSTRPAIAACEGLGNAALGQSSGREPRWYARGLRLAEVERSSVTSAGWSGS